MGSSAAGYAFELGVKVGTNVSAREFVLTFSVGAAGAADGTTAVESKIID